MYKFFTSFFIQKNRVGINEYGKLLEYILFKKHLADPEKSIARLKKQRGIEFDRAIRKNSLNNYETLIISGYADFIAKPLNRNLRSIYTKKHSSFMNYEYILNLALDQVSSYSNSTVYVMYECGDNEEHHYSWYENRIGESIQFPNFLSSSKRKWIEHKFYLVIKTSGSSSGKDIAHLTDKATSEEEVTFKSNSKFKIDKVDRRKYSIYLSEIETHVQANYLLIDNYIENITNKEDISRRI